MKAATADFRDTIVDLNLKAAIAFGLAMTTLLLLLLLYFAFFR